MNFDNVLKILEERSDIKPEEMPEGAATLIRMGISGEVMTPADFLIKIYSLHLKKQNQPLPRRPSDYDLDFVDKANEFFDVLAYRCLYTALKKQQFVTYEDPGCPLLDSSPKQELKVELTERGKQFFKELQDKIEEAQKKHQEAKK